MKKRRVETDATDIGGTYLPLSVYGQQGFDTEAIKANYVDKREHPVLGTTYKVKLDSERRSALEQVEREFVLRKTGQRHREVADGTCDDDKDAAGSKQGKRKSPSSDGASTSSQSSSSEKNKKKKKKSKHHKKKGPKIDKNDAEAAKKAEKQRQLAATAESRRAKQDATKMSAKVTPALLQLQSVLSDEHIAHVPKFATEKAKHVQKKLLAFDKESKVVLTSKCDVTSVLSSLADVAEACKEAATMTMMIREMLGTARRHIVVD